MLLLLSATGLKLLFKFNEDTFNFGAEDAAALALPEPLVGPKGVAEPGALVTETFVREGDTEPPVAELGDAAGRAPSLLLPAKVESTLLGEGVATASAGEGELLMLM